ncbi:GNAT family N-acetyltransferase [Streptomyces sp. URMC 129]|uniref:GNAT family N-acetyltransferase n=1 Tax=Streptomyces sp. URMC 129 TaxID=3423407 RepID=UPI003F1977D8
MDATIDVLRGEELLGRVDGVRDVYRATFGAAPWYEPPERADEFAERLRHDTARPGFLAAVASGADRVPLGFATAWTTPEPFPRARCYPWAAAGLGPARTAAWLCGAREVDELAVHPAAQGLGIGSALLTAVTADAPGGRAWLLTSAHSPATTRFYRREGWTRVTDPSPGDASAIVVFLGPRHPARAEGPAPGTVRD